MAGVAVKVYTETGKLINIIWIRFRCGETAPS